MKLVLAQINTRLGRQKDNLAGTLTISRIRPLNRTHQPGVCQPVHQFYRQHIRARLPLLTDERPEAVAGEPERILANG